MEHKPYRPVFAGQAKDGGYVVLYKHDDREEELYLLRPDGELWALAPEAEVIMTFDGVEDRIHISVKSPEWTGEAEGSKRELIEEESLTESPMGVESMAHARILGPVCPHCGESAPYGDERISWLRAHTDSRLHRWWWNIKRYIGGG